MSLEIILDYVGVLLAGLLGCAALLRANGSADRWAFAVGMLLLAAERLCAGLAVQRADLPPEVFKWQVWRLHLVALLPAPWLAFSLTYARGNAREFLRKWRFGLLAAALLPPVVALALRQDLIISSHALGDSQTLLLRLGLAGTAMQLALLAAAILILANLEHTFRSAMGTVRWRVKFMLMGVAVIFLVRLFTTSQHLLFRSLDPRWDVLNAGALLVGMTLMVRSLLRTGRFHLDIHPSHSVLHGSMTVVLVGVYLLLVGVLARIVSTLGGDASFTLKSLIVLLLLVLLGILLQSDRLRMYLGRFVSRHFQRPEHDYRTVWRKFTEGTASRVEPAEYNRAVVKLVAEIFQSLSVSLWVVDERQEFLRLGASTSLDEHLVREIQPTATESAVILEQMRTHPAPADFEKEPGAWAGVLRRCHPDEFHKGGTRVCVPVMSGREVLALLVLGDRVGGTAFTLQDLDLMKSIGDQVASGLLNVRLSQRLLQAREHEAFQTMATFFVHDLKNAASTLNLMLQNLPDHFDDPEFRQDALRGVGKSVAHINHLISRLTQLRSELKITPVASDLNDLVRGILGSFAAEKEFVVEPRLEDLPALPLDRDQFGKVITNLVLNTREAGATRLTLSTRRAGAWAVLETADNGGGIPPEFLSRSLFRPFQSTKKNGLGIGMFQSKMIIEAHGGRISVESTVGQGTSFRIFLPLTPLT
ncbi:PEP-CTERM system histidine kinase PrsK [Oleiharenicola lentus]|uniref:histidine kinase n=1 Tax=Oleiharenicola lentus TaxID=2508720 RepID=A0A4Q1C3L4_9BACT|nr:XrtA/PEP-CTERM system histidine kinase PrsK [Oleiharenicola lentus]RXK52930.1 PEP-CTERM system histidine kinase PrsK [Oleiharenicola lentus]